MVTLTRILVPHDFSETSDAAVQYAVALARQFTAGLDFLYVGDRANEELESELLFGGNGQVVGDVKDRFLRMLTPVDRVTLHPRFFVRAGTPAAEIVRFADQQHADLIVMGTHGRGFVAHILMGSVAEQVVRTAPCPVLTVRQPGQAGQSIALVAEVLEAAHVGV
ncbi:MAG: universal stress protein [Vicinamibacterales bacterium]